MMRYALSANINEAIGVQPSIYTETKFMFMRQICVPNGSCSKDRYRPFHAYGATSPAPSPLSSRFTSYSYSSNVFLLSLLPLATRAKGLLGRPDSRSLDRRGRQMRYSNLKRLLSFFVVGLWMLAINFDQFKGNKTSRSPFSTNNGTPCKGCSWISLCIVAVSRLNRVNDGLRNAYHNVSLS